MFGIKVIPCPIEITSANIVQPVKDDSSPHVTFSFKNNSDLIVTGLVLKVKCFDKNNVLLGELSNGSDSKVGLTVIVSNGLPNKEVFLNRNYTLLNGTKDVQVTVIGVMFEDDVEWDINAPKKLMKQRAMFFGALASVVIVVASLVYVFVTQYLATQNAYTITFNSAVDLIKQHKVYEAKYKLETLQNHANAHELLSIISGNNTITDSNIYFTSFDNDNKLYRSGLDGKDKKKLTDDTVSGFALKDNTIFYINKSDSDRIYKINTDGTNHTKISDDGTDELCIVNNTIIFCNLNDGHKLYRINFDGNGKLPLNNDFSSSISTLGETIVYLNRNDMGKIYSVRIDGTENRMISDYSATAVKVFKNIVYYINEKDNNKLYSVKPDGTSPNVRLSSFQTSNLAIIGNNLYFLNNSDNKYYLLNPEGELQPIQ